MGGNLLIPMTTLICAMATLLIAMAALTLAIAARAALDPEVDRLTPAPSAPLTSGCNCLCKGQTAHKRTKAIVSDHNSLNSRRAGAYRQRLAATSPASPPEPRHQSPSVPP